MGSPIGGRDDGAALDHHVGLDAEERRRPQHQVGELAGLHRADVLRHAVRDGRVDRVLRDVALGAGIVVVAGIADEPAALPLHLVGGLPGADDDLADAAHGLAVRRHHRERAEIVENILRRDGLLADAAFRKGEVLGDQRIEMMAHHQHVEMLVDGVEGKRPGRIGRGRQHIGKPRHLHDVGRVSAAGAFGVECVDGAALEGADGVLDKAPIR